MNRFIFFFLLLYLYSTAHGMKLALTKQQNLQQKKTKSNEWIVYEITIPFLNFKSKVNLGKTCKTWHKMINPGFCRLNADECKELNIYEYSSAMFYYGENHDNSSMQFLMMHANEINRQELDQFYYFITGYNRPSVEEIMQIYRKIINGGISQNFGFNAAYKGSAIGVLLSIKQKNKITVDSRDDGNANSLLHYVKPNTELSNYLILNMNDVNIKNNDGETPLHYSIKNIGRTQHAGPYVNLHMAGPTEYDCHKTKYLLQNSKIDMNATNKEGETPLHYAIKYYLDDGPFFENSPFFNALKVRTEIVQLLISHPKININSTNNKGETPLDYALRFRYIEDQEKIINLLTKYGALYGSFFQNHKKIIIVASLFSIFGLIGSIFAHLHYNSKSAK